MVINLAPVTGQSMTAADLIDAVRDDQQTELSRLGSSKTLYADTRGEMEPDVVLAAAAAREQAAHETFDAWSDDANDDAAALFVDAATETAERGDSTDAEPVDRTPAMHDVLDDLDGTVERLGGFVGWTLVDKKERSSSSASSPARRIHDREYVPQRRQRRGGPPRRGR